MSRNGREFSKNYKLVDGIFNGSYWECFYCGMPADSRDHCPPVSRISDYEALGLLNERYLLVRCCRSCNNLLGATLQESLLDRAEELKDILTEKHRAALKAPDWDEEELMELGPRLRSSVRASIRKKNQIQRRIEYYTAIDDYLASERL